MSENRKSQAKKKTTSSRKTATRKTASSKKKRSGGKVYIPVYKTIILCLSVIVICLVLLLITTLPKSSSPAETYSITERFEEYPPKEEKPEEKDEKLSSPDIKIENKKEASVKEPHTKKEEEKKPESKAKPAPAPAPETKKSEEAAKSEKKLEEKKVQEKKENKANEEAKPSPAPSFGFEKAKNKAQLIFVFDDGGQNLEHLKKFLELPFPITVAVLPQITHSQEAAQMVRNSGNELILHQPMQSVNPNINPGPGAITPDMNEEEIKQQLFTNINQIGPIAGMNNHEGSGITADIDKMEIILKAAEQAGIYFLDSRTNVETKVPYVAQGLGYTYYERNIFLDNEKTRANALSEIKKGLALANKNGSVIMIGHIWSADFLPALLKEIYPELLSQGYTFSLVSKSNAQKR